jgi:hypothetical protein
MDFDAGIKRNKDQGWRHRGNRRSLWLAAGAALLMIMGCSLGGRSAGPTSAPVGGEAPQAPADTATAKSQAQTVATGPCQDPPIQEVGMGSKTQSDVDAETWKRCYWVVAPEGLDTLTFHVTGLTDNLSLYVGFGFLYTMQYHFGEFWQSIEQSTADEDVTLEAPMGGPYFIIVQVAGPKRSSPFVLSVSSSPTTTTEVTGNPLPSEDTCDVPATEVALGSNTHGQMDGQGKWPTLARTYYCVQVPEGLPSLKVELHDLTDPLDLFVHNKNTIDWMDRSFQGTDRSVTIDNPEPGAYYIDVGAGDANASSAFTLSVGGP